MPVSSPRFFPLVLSLALGGSLAAEETPPDLADFKTVETAFTVQGKPVSAGALSLSGYLGVEVTPNAAGKLVITDLAARSPALTAGLCAGDQLRAIDGKPVGSADELRELLLAHSPDEVVEVEIERDAQPAKFPVTLGASSRPRKLAERRAVLGLTMAATESDEGIAVQQILRGSPAEAAGLRSGDLLLKVNDATLGIAMSLSDALADKEPGETVSVVFRRKGVESQVRAKLRASESGGPGSNLPPPLPVWKNGVYRLAVIPVEFPDVKHNEAIPLAEWEEMFFSTGAYAGKNNATGQPVHGSMQDYYREVSCGALRIEGRAFAWVQAGRKRAEYPALP